MTYVTRIKPENVVPGDKVIVTMTSDRGVTVSKSGTVGEIRETGRMRQAITRERGVLFTWFSGESGNPYQITLLERGGECLPEPLFNDDLMVRANG